MEDKVEFNKLNLARNALYAFADAYNNSFFDVESLKRKEERHLKEARNAIRSKKSIKIPRL